MAATASMIVFFFLQAEDGIRDYKVTGVQTCALPISISTQKFEIAMGMGPGMKRPTEMLQQKGWQIIEPAEHLPDPWTYREYLRRSKGEWSVAKEGYVKSRSGWFSCRSACYLALGRPCMLQDTGWSNVYPTGRGLFVFRTMDEALAGIDAINADYAAQSRAARQLAGQMFDARNVLADLITRPPS